MRIRAQPGITHLLLLLLLLLELVLLLLLIGVSAHFANGYKRIILYILAMGCGRAGLFIDYSIRGHNVIVGCGGYHGILLGQCSRGIGTIVTLCCPLIVYIVSICKMARESKLVVKDSGGRVK